MLIFWLLVFRGIIVLWLNYVWNWLFDMFFVFVIVNFIFFNKFIDGESWLFWCVRVEFFFKVYCVNLVVIFLILLIGFYLFLNNIILFVLLYIYSLWLFSLNYVCNFVDFILMCLFVVCF